ncbi:hypothetical protein B0H63DRAFT_526029 [Podospora didyma]|uniref:Uncharacterized protein n=1 Tax=Podospora didyma TaxID=330526 RepID=A0AAE0KEI9_9PEZI|nr:hypothetical protein B0H63DRAFT_526029 [Podospora didyma]
MADPLSIVAFVAANVESLDRCSQKLGEIKKPNGPTGRGLRDLSVEIERCKLLLQPLLDDPDMAVMSITPDLATSIIPRLGELTQSLEKSLGRFAALGARARMVKAYNNSEFKRFSDELDSVSSELRQYLHHAQFRRAAEMIMLEPIQRDSTLIREELQELRHQIVATSRATEALTVPNQPVEAPSSSHEPRRQEQQYLDSLLFEQKPSYQLRVVRQLVSDQTASGSRDVTKFSAVETLTYTALGDLKTWLTFAFRTPLSSTEDWTVGLNWNKARSSIALILHGLNDKDREAFVQQLEDSKSDTGHPMLVPALLCEMLVGADFKGFREHAVDLAQFERRTISYNSRGPTAQKTPEKEFAEMTNKLNLMTSRFAFHEMRLKASSSLIRQVKTHIDDIAKGLEKPVLWTGSAAEEAGKNMAEAIRTSGVRLLERLQQLDTERNYLLEEIACNLKSAQSQMQVVYNLIAQRESKDNLFVAVRSAKIADITKHDSYAMKTLAVMSLIFLPGAWMASLFAMPLFDWKAADGESVLQPKFWVYWAFTAPITIALLIAWFVWLKMHETMKQDDDLLRRRMDDMMREFNHPIDMSAQKPGRTSRASNFLDAAKARLQRLNIWKRTKPASLSPEDNVEDAEKGVDDAMLQGLQNPMINTALMASGAQRPSVERVIRINPARRGTIAPSPRR